MAGLDPNIILQAGRGVTPLLSPVEIEQQRAQREMQQLQLQQARQGMADEQTYRQTLMSTPADQLPTALYKAGLGKQGNEAAKFQTEQQKAAYERGKAVTDAMKVAADWVMQNPTEQSAISALDEISSRYQIDPKNFDAGKAAIYAARNDPNKIRQLMGGLGAKADEALGKIESVNLGGVQQTQRTNPYTGETQVLGQQQRTQSPESMASVAQSAANAQMTDARMREQNALRAQATAQGRVPAGYRLGPDGQSLEFIPGGPADPTSKAGGGKPLTEGQSKALLFGTRMQEANAIFDELADNGVTTSIPGSRAGFGLGSAINALQPADRQRLDQAKRDFLNAVLRRESGAVIADAEFNNGDKQYFPQPGDSEAVIAQKKRNREVAMRGILAEVPDADSRVAQVRGVGTSPTKPGVPLKKGPSSKTLNIDGKEMRAERAPDGKYYVQQNGKWFEVKE